VPLNDRREEKVTLMAVDISVEAPPTSPEVAHPSESLRLLLVEDSVVDARLVVGLLRSEWQFLICEHVATLAEALHLLNTVPFHVVLLDLNLGDSAGYTTFSAVHHAAPHTAILVLSSSNDEELATRTVREGAQDYLVKGTFDSRLLVRSIRYAFERKRSEEALRRSETTVRAIFENSLDGIVIVGEDGVFIEANQAAATLFGVTRQELTGNSIHNFTTADFKDQWRRFQASGTGRGEFWVHRHDGSKRLADCGFSANILPGRDLYMMRDITEQQDLEEQLRQSQKMEAVGRLAGGVAHDFNNILGIISGYAELMQMRSADEWFLSHTGRILAATQRASTLTKQLLAFGRRQFVTLRLLDVGVIVSEMREMVQCLMGAEVELLIEASAGQGLIKADQGQLEQTVLNLAANARDAMPSGGTMKLSVARCSTLGEQPEVAEGQYITLTVSDTGTGMDEEIQSQIFEPFFTTKKTASGLGLSTVYGIVKQSGGYITVKSAPNEGSSFTAYFPVAENMQCPASSSEEMAPSDGHETILLVDDQSELLEATAEYLEGCGYHVLKAADGEEGIAILDSYQGDIAVVITDLVMPKVSGRALVDHVRSTRPQTGTLVISGYSDDAVVKRGIFLDTTSFLQKPFAFDVMTAKVRSLIDSRGKSS
jgi:two-component system, cell cycle sensor histidine kinase and response regulator CckA